MPFQEKNLFLSLWNSWVFKPRDIFTRFRKQTQLSRDHLEKYVYTFLCLSDIKVIATTTLWYRINIGKFKNSKSQTASPILVPSIEVLELTYDRHNKTCLCESGSRCHPRYRTHTDCFWKNSLQNKSQLQTFHLCRHVSHQNLCEWLHSQKGSLKEH